MAERRRSPGPPRVYDRTMEVKVTEDLYVFVTDLAKLLKTSKGGVLRALAEAHKDHLTAVASDYVGSLASNQQGQP